MSWLKRLFGIEKASVEQRKSPVTAEPSVSSRIISEDDPRISEGQDKVLAFWQAIGSVEDEVVAYLVNPMFLGAPAWPNTRQAYRIIRTPDSLIVASDGLSDPFVSSDRDDVSDFGPDARKDVSGFGLEAYIEVSGAQDWSFDQISKSAEFELIETVAKNVAGHGGIAELLDQVGVLSMAVPLTKDLPDGWQDSDGQVGVLIGMPVPGRESLIDLPFGPCRFVAVTPILPAELDAAAGSTQGRNDIARKLAETPSGWRFDAGRA